MEDEELLQLIILYAPLILAPYLYNTDFLNLLKKSACHQFSLGLLRIFGDFFRYLRGENKENQPLSAYAKQMTNEENFRYGFEETKPGRELYSLLTQASDLNARSERRRRRKDHALNYTNITVKLKLQKLLNRYPDLENRLFDFFYYQDVSEEDSKFWYYAYLRKIKEPYGVHSKKVNEPCASKLTYVSILENSARKQKIIKNEFEKILDACLSIKCMHPRLERRLGRIKTIIVSKDNIDVIKLSDELTQNEKYVTAFAEALAELKEEEVSVLEKSMSGEHATIIKGYFQRVRGLLKKRKIREEYSLKKGSACKSSKKGSACKSSVIINNEGDWLSVISYVYYLICLNRYSSEGNLQDHRLQLFLRPVDRFLPEINIFGVDANKNVMHSPVRMNNTVRLSNCIGSFIKVAQQNITKYPKEKSVFMAICRVLNGNIDFANNITEVSFIKTQVRKLLIDRLAELVFDLNQSLSASKSSPILNKILNNLFWKKVSVLSAIYYFKKVKKPCDHLYISAEAELPELVKLIMNTYQDLNQYIKRCTVSPRFKKLFSYFKINLLG